MANRALVIAWQKAMLLYIAHGFTWTDSMAAFVKWTFDYGMWSKLFYFGTELERQIKEENSMVSRRPTQSMLARLPDTFSRKEYIAFRRNQNSPDERCNALYKW